MIYDVEINGRNRRVEVTRHAQAFEVSVDGRRQAATVAQVNGTWSLILSDVPAPGASGHVTQRSYEVAISEAVGGGLTVQVDGRTVQATVSGAQGSWARRGGEGGAAGKGPQKITAPMPGKIVKVLVKAGDAVAARQGVVVVEAMKMENELKVARAGTVKEVKAVEGASVEAGSVLVIVE
ncbi:MAG: biotin/lipoyl-containing protein [Vicinamibacterales bacterium]